jgi:hypothetical protein
VFDANTRDCKGGEEPGLSMGTEVPLDQERSLDEDADRKDKLLRRALELGYACSVVCITNIGCRVEQAGIDDDHAPKSLRRISSALSKMSLRPLSPSAMNPNLCGAGCEAGCGAGPTSVATASEASPRASRRRSGCRRLLRASGWRRYGETGDSCPAFGAPQRVGPVPKFGFGGASEQ